MLDNDNDSDNIATDCLPDLPPHGDDSYDGVVTGIATTQVATRRGWRGTSSKGGMTWALHDDQPGLGGPVFFAARVAMSDAMEVHYCCSVLRLRLDDPHPWFSMVVEGEEHESICGDEHEVQVMNEEEEEDMTMSWEATTSQLPSSITLNAPSPNSPSSGRHSDPPSSQSSNKQENEVGITSTDAATQAQPIAVEVADHSPVETPSPVTHDRPYPTPQPSPTSTRIAEVDATHDSPTPAPPMADPRQTTSALSTKHTPWPSSDPFLDQTSECETPKAQRGRFKIDSPSSTSASGASLKRSRSSSEEVCQQTTALTPVHESPQTALQTPNQSHQNRPSQAHRAPGPTQTQTSTSTSTNPSRTTNPNLNTSSLASIQTAPPLQTETQDKPRRRSNHSPRNSPTHTQTSGKIPRVERR